MVAAARDAACVGLSIACYDPGMDIPAMTGARDVAEMITRILGASTATNGALGGQP